MGIAKRLSRAFSFVIAVSASVSQLVWIAGVLFVLPSSWPLASAHGAASSRAACRPHPNLSAKEFRDVMDTVSIGWNEGRATVAAACFAENAQYSAPPSPPKIGRLALYEYFGGAKGRELPMRIQWHHLVFDPRNQIGIGEYTFKYRIQTHGIVIVKVENGLISNWREYEVESELPWDQFVGTNRF
jgi:hypothetical protein